LERAVGEQIRELQQLGFELDEICRILNIGYPPEAERFVTAAFNGELVIVDRNPSSQVG
jgi:hypothetical protein